MRGLAITPSGMVLVGASEANLRAGHENLGFLSETHGFMPRAEPALHLPASHRAWDDLAAELPELFGGLAVRRAVDALPMLPAGEGALADEHLLRAGALLGILAHAYWWAEREPPPALPAGIATPWQTVSHRLGQPAPHLSYVDIVVYNWRVLDREQSDPRRVENMRLLIPIVGNEPEHIFYLTQAEILARCAPAVNAVVLAQAAARADDPEALIEALDAITATLDEAVRHSLPKINPLRSSRTHVDPLWWSKTVAPFAVPFSPSVVGPSGTSSPIFHVLDAFFGRAAHRTRLGREMTHLHQWHPRHWRDFVDAVRRTSVGDYVEARRHPPLRIAYDEAVARYAGESGFLGRHRLKVYGYLELAFKVGRTVTIGGFSGPFRARAWNEVDSALTLAAAERQPSLTDDSPTAGLRTPSISDERRIARSSLVSHNDDRAGRWIAVDGVVYDATGLRHIHPGGAHILDAHAGTDATAVFHRIGHHSSRKVRALAPRYRIGVLDPEPPTRDLYRAWIHTAYLIAEMENALRIDHMMRSAGTGATPLTLRFLSEVHERFLHNYLDAVTGEIAEDLWRRTLTTGGSAKDPQWMRHRMNRIRQGPDHAAVVAAAGTLAADVRTLAASIGPAVDLTMQRLDYRCRLLERVDTALLGNVKQIVRTGAQLLEQDGIRASYGAELLVVLRRLPESVARYCHETAAHFQPARLG